MNPEEVLEKVDIRDILAKEGAPTKQEIQATSEAFSGTKLNFVYKHPFFGLLLLNLDPVVSGLELPTAAVNYTTLYMCGVTNDRATKLSKKLNLPEPIKTIPFTELSTIGQNTILAHELLHLVFEHLDCPRSFDKNVANIAMDSVINRILDKENSNTFSLKEISDACVMPFQQNGEYSGFTVGSGKNQKSFTIPDFHEADWVKVYWHMIDQMEKEAKKNGAKSREEIAASIKKQAEAMGKSNPMQGDAALEDEEDETAERSQQKSRFRQKIIQAVDEARKQGNCPAEMDRYVDGLTTPKIHWTDHLRKLLKTEIAHDDFSHKMNSRRAHISQMSGRGRMPPVFPKVESETIGAVFLALDTSGSMSQEDIKAGLSEFAGLRQTTPFDLYFMSCDAQAYDVKHYNRLEEPDWSEMPIKGGGGTDFRPVFEIIEDYKKEKAVKPTLLVFFTDTYGCFPAEAPEYPVIWVTHWSGGEVPWGELIRVND